MAGETDKFGVEQAVQAAINVINNSKTPPELQLGAMERLGQYTAQGGFAFILPTNGVEGTEELFREIQQRNAGLCASLNAYLFRKDEAANGPARDAALDLLQTYATLQEAAQVIADETREIPVDPNGNPPPDVPDLNDGLEPGDDPSIRASHAIHGPFVHFGPFRRCREETCCTGVEKCGCSVVVKEFRGLQLRRVLRLITRVIEPWTSRQRILRRWVWVLEWVPVQVIKTIRTPCGCDHEGTRIEQRCVLDRKLSTFWRCL